MISPRTQLRRFPLAGVNQFSFAAPAAQLVSALDLPAFCQAAANLVDLLAWGNRSDRRNTVVAQRFAFPQ